MGLADASGRRSLLTSLVVYSLTLLITYSVVTINMPTSYVHIHYALSYGYAYTVLKNACVSALILYFTYLVAYSVLHGRYKTVNHLLIIASASLLVLSYAYLVSYVATNNLIVTPLPLVIVISSPLDGNSVIGLDWGQVSLLTMLLAYNTSRCRRQHTSGRG